MIMLPMQLFGAVIALGMMYMTFLSIKREELKFSECFHWFFIWAVLLLISVYPKFIDYIKPIVDVSRILDLIFIISILVLFTVMFQLFLITKKTEKKIDTLIEELK